MPKNAPGFARRVSSFLATAKQYNDIFLPTAVKAYFIDLYQWEQLDKNNILGSIENPLNFPFPQMARDYRFIENDMQSVIIARDEEAKHLVEKLEHAEHVSAILRNLQAYTVQIYKNELDALLKGCVSLVREQFYVAFDGAGYSDTLGLCVEDPAFWEVGAGIF